jgi:hypothetical protein
MLAIRASWLLALAPLACGGKSPARAAEASRVTLSEQSPPAGYVEVRAVSVQSGKGCGIFAERGSREGAEQLLRQAAEKLGATFVRITHRREPRPNHNCLEHEYQLDGVAYRLPAPVPASPTFPRTLLDFEDGSLGKPARSTERSSVALSLATGETSGSALSVGYRCSGSDAKEVLRVWFELGRAELRGAHALSLRVKPDRAGTLTLFFEGENQQTWAQESAPLSADVWQTLTLELDKFSSGSSGPSALRAPKLLGVAPTDCTDGHFLFDDVRVE